MSPILSIQGLSKTYAGGREALKRVNLEIAKGEIFALLWPNGAGKTTLINIVCGIVTPSSGTVTPTLQLPLMIDPTAAIGRKRSLRLATP